MDGWFVFRARTAWSSYVRACSSLIPVMRALVSSSCPSSLRLALCGHVLLGCKFVYWCGCCGGFVGWNCCSGYFNRLLCLRLCHIGIFQVRILSRAFMCSDGALVGPLPQACLLLALALGLTPSI